MPSHRPVPSMARPTPRASTPPSVPSSSASIGWAHAAFRLRCGVLVLVALLSLTGPAEAVDGTWSAIVEPDYRALPGLAVDSTGGALFLFGGSDRFGSNTNKLWRYDLRGATGWSMLPAGPTPPPARSGPYFFHDAVRGRLIVAGFSPVSDIWTYGLGSPSGWSQVPATGAVLPATGPRGLVFDPVGNRLLAVIFPSSAPIQVWALSMDSPSWVLLGTLPALLGSPFGVRLIYDAGHDVVLLEADPGPTSAQLYSLSIRGPLAMAPLGASGANDTGHGATLDTHRRRYLTFGGGDNFFFPESNTTWSLDLDAPVAWVNRTPPSPSISVRQAMSVVYDPIGDRLLCFGGLHQIPNPPFGTTNIFYDEFWQQSFGSSPAPWSRATLKPGARQNPRMVYAMAESSAFLFGGYDGAVRMDLWRYRSAGNPQAEQLTISGAPPVARDREAMAYDSKRNRLVMFGGFNFPARLNDVIGVQLGATPSWLALTPSGPAPPGRVNNQMVYDSIGDRFIMFGGSTATSRVNDVWTLDATGATGWQALTPLGTPPTPREFATLMFDPLRNRVVMFGGNDGAARNDLWELLLSGTPEWRPLVANGAAPSPRAAHMAAYDPLRDRMLIHGGFGTNYLSEVWALSLADTASWSLLTTDGEPAPARTDHGFCYDPVRDALLLGPGILGQFVGDHWSLQFPAPLLDAPKPGPRPDGWSALAAPNPARTLMSLTIEQPTAGAADVEWFDLTGRRLATDRVELAAGTTHWKVPGVTWAKVRAQGHGLVLYRVRTQDRVITGKVAIVD